MSRQRTAAILGAVAVIAVVVGVTGGAGAAPSTADAGHGAENGNYTVNLPFATDHYPRSKNPGGPNNGSINHYAAGTQELFDEAGASKGVEQLKYLKIDNPDIDFSQCSTSNTAAFGIDRNSDDPGTKVDIDLLRYMEKNAFNDHSIEVYFYEGDELASPSPNDKGGAETGKEDGDGNAEMYPDDQIVAHQGYKSGGGPCYGMPTDPGWYQISGFVNGTAFNGNEVEVSLTSHYFYICECQTEKEAYNQLGAPPGQENPYEGGSGNTTTATATATPEQTATAGGGGGDGGGESTPTATATATATATPTATATGTPTATDASGDDGASAGGGGGGGAGAAGGTATVSATAGASAGGGGGGGGSGGGGSGGGGSGGSGGGAGAGGAQQAQAGSGPMTPTAGAGPGFGLVAALGGLAAAALLALRRD
ncbi:hypothetical protein [Haloglomus litoreum]|uniref:hypothetical protein n=1 Tax=Haloglomus litoreum TaxID=3034026 RepID=UPI0023E7DC70|nr:hypothetical protein [Haloglomus sp. DT116]